MWTFLAHKDHKVQHKAPWDFRVSWAKKAIRGNAEHKASLAFRVFEAAADHVANAVPKVPVASADTVDVQVTKGFKACPAPVIKVTMDPLDPKVLKVSKAP